MVVLSKIKSRSFRHTLGTRLGFSDVPLFLG
jgi:hypothetical protein